MQNQPRRIACKQQAGIIPIIFQHLLLACLILSLFYPSSSLALPIPGQPEGKCLLGAKGDIDTLKCNIVHNKLDKYISFNCVAGTQKEESSIVKCDLSFNELTSKIKVPNLIGPINLGTLDSIRNFIIDIENVTSSHKSLVVFEGTKPKIESLHLHQWNPDLAKSIKLTTEKVGQIDLLHFSDIANANLTQLYAEFRDFRLEDSKIMNGIPEGMFLQANGNDEIELIGNVIEGTIHKEAIRWDDCSSKSRKLVIDNCKLVNSQFDDGFIKQIPCAKQRSLELSLLNNNFDGLIPVPVQKFIQNFNEFPEANLTFRFDPINCCSQRNQWLWNSSVSSLAKNRKTKQLDIKCIDLGDSVKISDFESELDLGEACDASASNVFSILIIVTACILVLTIMLAAFSFICFYYVLPKYRNELMINKQAKTSSSRLTSESVPTENSTIPLSQRQANPSAKQPAFGSFKTDKTAAVSERLLPTLMETSELRVPDNKPEPPKLIPTTKLLQGGKYEIQPLPTERSANLPPIKVRSKNSGGAAKSPIGSGGGSAGIVKGKKKEKHSHPHNNHQHHHHIGKQQKLKDGPNTKHQDRESRLAALNARKRDREANKKGTPFKDSKTGLNLPKINYKLPKLRTSRERPPSSAEKVANLQQTLSSGERRLTKSSEKAAPKGSEKKPESPALSPPSPKSLPSPRSLVSPKSPHSPVAKILKTLDSRGAAELESPAKLQNLPKTIVKSAKSIAATPKRVSGEPKEDEAMSLALKTIN